MKKLTMLSETPPHTAAKRGRDLAEASVPRKWRTASPVLWREGALLHSVQNNTGRKTEPQQNAEPSMKVRMRHRQFRHRQTVLAETTLRSPGAAVRPDRWRRGSQSVAGKGAAWQDGSFHPRSQRQPRLHPPRRTGARSGRCHNPCLTGACPVGGSPFFWPEAPPGGLPSIPMPLRLSRRQRTALRAVLACPN